MFARVAPGGALDAAKPIKEGLAQEQVDALLAATGAGEVRRAPGGEHGSSRDPLGRGHGVGAKDRGAGRQLCVVPCGLHLVAGHSCQWQRLHLSQHPGGSTLGGHATQAPLHQHLAATPLTPLGSAPATDTCPCCAPGQFAANSSPAPLPPTPPTHPHFALPPPLTPPAHPPQGDLLLFAAGPAPTVDKALGRVRLYLGKALGLVPEGVDALLWVTDWPLFEWNADENRWGWVRGVKLTVGRQPTTLGRTAAQAGSALQAARCLTCWQCQVPQQAPWRASASHINCVSRSTCLAALHTHANIRRAPSRGGQPACDGIPVSLTTSLGRWEALHHPFTAPNPDSLEAAGGDLTSATALAYDLVYNGTEVGGGSLRIYR